MNLELEEHSADFPAAHSMDTTWFAVDADGNVGVFDSSEDGAVPNAAATGGGAAEPSFDTFLLEAARLARAGTDAPDLLEGWRAESERPPSPGDGARAVVVLGDPRLTEGPDHHRSSPAALRTIEDSFPDAGWRVVHDAEPRVLASTKRLSSDALLELERRRDVAAVIFEDELHELLLDAGGAFRYRHDDGETYEPGRYVREGPPSKEPLKLSDLSPSDQAHVGKVVLPLRFAETDRLQLADMMRDEDCSMWAETTLRGAPLGERRDGVEPRSRGGARVVLVLAVVAVVLFILWRMRGP